MSKLICPECNSEHTAKCIAGGFPVKVCLDCSCLWGEPWATIYTGLVAPIEGLFNDEFSFFPYEGSYWLALYAWFRADLDE